jgi:hypothetical protein
MNFLAQINANKYYQLSNSILGVKGAGCKSF